MIGRRTKLVCTIGPATADRVDELVAAGMDVARLNFSHAGHDEVARLVERIRSIDVDGRRAAILVDLHGLKLRIRELATPLLLHEGERLVLTANVAGGVVVVEAVAEAFRD